MEMIVQSIAIAVVIAALTQLCRAVREMFVRQ